MIDKAELITEGILAFEPEKDRDIFATVDDKTYRFIFNKALHLQPEEVIRLEEFREYLDKNKLKIPEGYDDVTFEILKFL